MTMPCRSGLIGARRAMPEIEVAAHQVLDQRNATLGEELHQPLGDVRHHRAERIAHVRHHETRAHPLALARQRERFERNAVARMSRN